MNREPVNPDDPDLTAYALGEMSPGERAEFERKLEASPTAIRELESMEDMMSLLSKGLREEWCTEMKQPSLEVLPPVSPEEVIVPVQFKRSRRALVGIAAAVAAMLVAGTALVTAPRGDVEVAEAQGSDALLDAVDGLVVESSSGVHVPRLFLADEAEEVGGIELAEALENLDDVAAPIDASYLEARSVEPASATSNQMKGHFIPAGFGSFPANERVDSYLPPVGDQSGDLETGLIEGRVGKPMFVSNSDGSSRVFVRGYVTMGGESGREAARQGSRILAGFRPVSISGNPVENAENDLRILSDLQSIQNDLSRVLETLPEGASTRNELQALLDRNRKAVSELKREFAR